MKKEIDIIEKEKKTNARVDAFVRHAKETLKSRRVKPGKPINLIIDKGGVLITDGKKAGDKKKTFVIVNWFANGQEKEFIMSFNDHDESIRFAEKFKVEFKNTRILQTLCKHYE